MNFSSDESPREQHVPRYLTIRAIKKL